jgi:hypothetical protein
VGGSYTVSAGLVSVIPHAVASVGGADPKGPKIGTSDQWMEGGAYGWLDSVVVADWRSSSRTRCSRTSYAVVEVAPA